MHPWPGYIRALTYPILFEARPVEGIDRVIKTVVDTKRLGREDEFLQAISQALASNEDLGQLVSDDHTDQTIREFLVELAKTLRARPEPLLPGWPDASYLIEALLSKGTFADVYRARRGGSLVALKVSASAPRSPAELGPSATQGFVFHTGTVGAWAPSPREVLEREAVALQGIEHPAFPRVLEAGTVRFAGNEHAFYASELVAGSTWRALLREGRRIPLHAIVELIDSLESVRASESLAYHGDLKPDNLFFSEGASPSVKIIDPASPMTDMEGILPRTMLTTESYNPRWAASDIPALGMLIIEAMTGRQPLREVDPTRPERRIGQTLHLDMQGALATGRHANVKLFSRMPMPEELDPKIPPRVAEVALSCLGLRWDGNVLEWTQAPKNVSLVRQALLSLG